MPGLVLNGLERPVPGRTFLNWNDDKRLRLRPGEDCGPRPDGTMVQSIVLHTTLGEAGPLFPGQGPDLGKELRVAEWWSTSGRSSGAHLVVDTDGTGGCLADLLKEQAYHASGRINRRSIGIEQAQGPKKELYVGQIEACADLIDVLTAQFGIQRVIPDRYRGRLARLDSPAGGVDFVGICGHRDCTNDRDEHDPGEYLFEELARRGYRKFNLAAREDVTFWKDVQTKLGVDPSGVPGRATVRALKEAGYAFGLLPVDVAI